MRVFKTEPQAFQAAGDKAAALCLEGEVNCGFRILTRGKQFVVLMVPERSKLWSPVVKTGLPFYLD